MKRKNNKFILLLLSSFIIVLCIPFYFQDKLNIRRFRFKPKAVSILTYSDLIQLSQKAIPQGALKLKLAQQLNKPYIFNKHKTLSFLPHRLKTSSGQNKTFSRAFLRVAHWNIERGFNIEPIKKIISKTSNYFYSYKRNIKSNLQNEFRNEIQDLMSSDIVCLNEVDIGMPRTNYRNIVSELARELNYNYAFATEFVELSPLVHKLKTNPRKYLGLHGNAILSRYPIKNAFIIRLPECYKWFHGEIGKKSPLEHARRFGAKTVFSEQILTEVRHGSRCALICEVELPNKEIVTIVSIHLEDRCYPDKRFKQAEYVFGNLRNIRTPLIIAGDFNTTTTDSAPTSVKKEITKRLRDPHFIARQAILVAASAPLPGVANLAAFTVGKALQYKDPTVPSIPILFPNQERKLFQFIKNFQFTDGGMIDCSGDPKNSSNGKNGFLANSNERALKGFESTFKFEEPRLIAYFKLHWFFVKPKGKKIQPFNGKTLRLVNHAYPGRVSDHEPITVDLRL